MKPLKILIILTLPFFMISCLDDDDYPNNGGGTDLAEKFLGVWHVYEPDKKLNYDVTIKRHLNSNTDVDLINFADVGNAKGMCVNNTIVIENQQLGNYYTVEGTGYYENKKKLTFSYTLSDGIDSEVRTAIFTRE